MSTWDGDTPWDGGITWASSSSQPGLGSFVFRAEKVIAALPAELEPNTVYFVRAGQGYDVYVSDMMGAIAHTLNLPAETPVYKSVTLDAPTAPERIILFNQRGNLVLNEIRGLLPGGVSSPSVTFNIGYGSNVSLLGTELWSSDQQLTNTDTGTIFITPDNPTIPDGAWVWLSVKEVSGVVPTLHLTLKE